MFIQQKLKRITIYTISFGRYINFLLVFKEFLETIPDGRQILAVRYMESSFFLVVYTTSGAIVLFDHRTTRRKKARIAAKTIM